MVGTEWQTDGFGDPLSDLTSGIHLTPAPHPARCRCVLPSRSGRSAHQVSAELEFPGSGLRD